MKDYSKHSPAYIEAEAQIEPVAGEDMGNYIARLRGLTARGNQAAADKLHTLTNSFAYKLWCASNKGAAPRSA